MPRFIKVVIIKPPLIDHASRVEETLAYHDRTKHHFHRYARSSGYLDWALQPNPFRFWEGTDAVKLPFLNQDPDMPYGALYASGRRMKAQEFNLRHVAAFFEMSLGLSAWKESSGTRWALRINPSSGNLHPTEGYAVLPAMDAEEGGIFHYNPFLHALERRAVFTHLCADLLKKYFQTSGFLVALSSIFWRESWKYGERAFRYCQHDAGHALAALTFSARLLGWKVVFLNAVADDEISALLGFDKVRWIEEEEEHPDMLCFVHDPASVCVRRDLPNEVISASRGLNFTGTPNRLSGDHVVWEAISRAASATSKPSTSPDIFMPPPRPLPAGVDCPLPAARVIRQRRSAVRFDAVTAVSQEQFFAMLDKTLPHPDAAPFNAQLGPARVHLFVFVHRVTDLEPGLYFWIRNEEDLADLKRLSSKSFAWRQSEKNVPLYFLKHGDFRDEASQVSCYQDIAADSAFSLGQIARFRGEVEQAPFRYRQLFWETGMIGQVLYLEAEAQGIRATGIGCFFDDAVHELIGLKDDTFQSLYHFTVGGPVEDHRLTTLPAYGHLSKTRA